MTLPRKLIVYTTLFLALGCSKLAEEVESPAKGPPGEETPYQELWDTETTVTKMGVVQSRVKAHHVALFEEKGITQLDGGIQVDFYDERGNHTSVLMADRGVIFEKIQDMEAIGNVVVVSDSGMTLKTEKLRWNNRSRKIISDEFVTITTEVDTLYGVGFISDESLQNWEIRQPTGVTGRKRLKTE